MRILILGIDGYLGWPTALRMINKGYDVYGMDNFLKRKQLQKYKVSSGFKIKNIANRINDLKQYTKKLPKFFEGSVSDRTTINTIIKKIQPDTVFDFSHIPSAPYSMMNAQTCVDTWRNNTEGNLYLLWALKEFSPKTHLIKLGTLGEYGTPNVPIPEGTFDYKTKDGKYKDKLPFPRQAGSFYHQSKVANSHNLNFASKIWNIKSTDVMQGIIYGTQTPEIIEYNSKTNFYFDELFGTVINRMLASTVISKPLPVYGKGTMIRGILSLNDVVDCYELIMENSPDSGKYRVINQFDEKKSIISIAKDVMRVGKNHGYSPTIKFYKDPRIEKAKHLYEPESKWLDSHGYRRNFLFQESIKLMLDDISKIKKTIKKYEKTISPKTTWA